MKDRAEVARLIEAQMECYTGEVPKARSHYGYVELRELLDYLYDGLPENTDQELVNRRL